MALFRWIAVLAATVSVACGGKQSGYATADFRSFESRYQRYGSAGYQFGLDSDCTVKNGTGKTALLPIDRCDDLRTYVLSDAMIEAAQGTEDCSDATDTSLFFRVQLADSEAFQRTELCLDREPYRTLLSKIDGIRGTILPD